MNQVNPETYESLMNSHIRVLFESYEPDSVVQLCMNSGPVLDRLAGLLPDRDGASPWQTCKEPCPCPPKRKGRTFSEVAVLYSLFRTEKLDGSKDVLLLIP